MFRICFRVDVRRAEVIISIAAHLRRSANRHGLHTAMSPRDPASERGEGGLGDDRGRGQDRIVPTGFPQRSMDGSAPSGGCSRLATRPSGPLARPGHNGKASNDIRKRVCVACDRLPAHTRTLVSCATRRSARTLPDRRSRPASRSRLERHISNPSIVAPSVEARWNAFNSTIRSRPARRSPYSSSAWSSPSRMACSIRAISRRAA